ncbi:MAG: rhodanese-like domain-containing protein [Oscillospiraceae bacterium]|nr:rhodanese-like domain-containing protein [Oscillospiraceae bacterium]
MYKNISAETAKKMMGEEKPYILLDVRSAAEFKEIHIPGAILIPNDQIKTRAKDELPDKDALILVYCRSGARAAGAANDLDHMGYKNVYNFGGIMNWSYETARG